MNFKNTPPKAKLEFGPEEISFMRYAMKKVINDLDEQIYNEIHQQVFHAHERENEEAPKRRGRPPMKKTVRRTRK
jgi:hypothetical protein